MFDLALEDGSTRSLRAVAGLVREERAGERERFLERLHASANRAGVELTVHVPRRGIPR